MQCNNWQYLRSWAKFHMKMASSNGDRDDQGSDLSQLEQLTSDNILGVLRDRYYRDQIYTNCGNILISLNPYKSLPIYNEQYHEDYNWRNFTNNPKPHIYHVAARAYRCLRENNSNQVILINPLLEAFGNARTTMNDNSSRFAKYLGLRTVRDYMLEKSRVVSQNEHEGNFHIFYSLFAGASKQQLEDLYLDNPESYRIMKKIEFVETDYSTSELDIKDKTPLSREEDIECFKSKSQAEDGRDALAKALYERLFGWLVRQINHDLHPSRSSTRSSTEIGVLDIAGFEKLHVNSFEQLCINIVNERLQNFMNETVFTMERQIYEEDGLHIDDVTYKNNEPTIKLLIGTKTGILVILDEETKFQQGRDSGFVHKVVQKHEKNDLFQKCTGDRPEFGIRHFAGPVWYNAKGILDKNRDQLGKDLTKCLQGSSDIFVSDIFTVKKGPTGTISATHMNIGKSTRVGLGGGREDKKMKEKGRQLEYGKLESPTPIVQVYNPKDHKTVVSYFQSSMNELLNKMQHADPHFKPDNFTDTSVKDQLLYNGVCEIANIRKIGYSVRKKHAEFIQRYSQLYPESRSQQDAKQKIEIIMEKILPLSFRDDFRMGKYRVFLKENISTFLEKCVYMRQREAAKILVCNIRKYLVKRRKEREEEERRQKYAFSNNDEKNEKTTSQTTPTAEPAITEMSSSNQSTDSSTASYSWDTELGASQSSQSSFANYRGTTKKSSPPPSRKKTKLKHETEPKRTNEETEQVHAMPQKKGKQFWDIFQIIAREGKSGDVHTSRSMRILKVITYFVLFLLLLFCLISQKVTLMTLVSGLRNISEEDKKTEINRASARYLLLLIALTIPYLLTILVSISKALFGNMPFPAFRSIFIVVLVELLHTCGLCILLFRILPELDMARGIMLMNATCLLPCLLKPFCASNFSTGKAAGNDKRGKMLRFILDLLSVIVQLSVYPIIILCDYYQDRTYFKMHHDINEINVIEAVFAIFLVSFSWWENFVDDRFFEEMNDTNPLRRFILGIKFDLQESRPKIMTFCGFLKTGLAVTLAYLFRGDLKFDLGEVMGQLKNDEIQENVSIIVLTLTAFVSYYVANTACKLQLQKFCFSLPLILSTPLAVLLVLYHCENTYLNDFFLEARECSTFWQKDLTKLHVISGFLWLISLYWISRHIWFPSQRRLVKVERLFVSPLYCGILLEQDLVLNRRRNNQMIKRTINKSGKEYEFRMVDSTDAGVVNKNNIQNKSPPMIYACATMWHENRQEMVQIMKSLYRMDKDQFTRKQALQMADKDTDLSELEYYNFEPHILFDDAFDIDDDGEFVPNRFVLQMIDVLDEAASTVHQQVITNEPPFKIPTPYGGQLVFEMPCGNLMYLHLKNKSKIRHRKRWSQVMYMYYLLGYRLIRSCQEKIMAAIETGEYKELDSWSDRVEQSAGNIGKSQIFQFMGGEKLHQAQNTYILALDGDVDFSPGAVRILVDRMNKNPKVGAACGRIHPIGKGPVVWYQKFEYAVAHWLQKATEHVLGCVLCSPGCFSLFRGEDRWLCTLLLQQGYRVDYAAASDAYTYAPEGFAEFFNQRRRWMPSTIANVLDLLQDAGTTVAVNSNISYLYIFYQAALMLSTILGPSTILMMIAGAIQTVFILDLIPSYIISVMPVVFYFFICFFIKKEYQILLAEIFSAVYVFIMMVVLIGSILTAAKESPFHPSVIFLAFLGGIFLIAACFHPQEFGCIIFGALYFITIPTGFLLLVLYSLINLNDVSWGTREVPKKKTKEEIEAEEQAKKEKEEKKKQGFIARLMPKINLGDFKDFFGDVHFSKRQDRTTELLEKMNQNMERFIASQEKSQSSDLSQVVVDKEESKPTKGKKSVSFASQMVETKSIDDDYDEDTSGDEEKKKEKKTRNDLVNPKWIEVEKLGDGEVMQIDSKETEYLKPIELDNQAIEQMKAELTDLRNSVCGGMAMINLIWLAINFMFQLKSPLPINIQIGNSEDEGRKYKQYCY
ncbi:hypothetical protein KUTeg_015305 [Tegillarca granosa]|uniref:chitin synthase n=1 Tax=Tegillarca granosa TaxID=220873 RepID=A0ABQ9EPQ2_TEGGR|nr:hypothetical protein KUTeg_015305 [Tegillarca granosa]